MTAGAVVVLNGVSSSGKTTVARALGRSGERPWLHLGVDALVDGLDRRWVDDAVRVGEDGELVVGPVARTLGAALRAAVVAAARSGVDVVADDLFLEREWYDGWRRDLSGLRALVVGVVAPLELVEERERGRGDRLRGAARAQLPLVHSWGDYDLVLDTATAGPEACAQAILTALASLETRLTIVREAGERGDRARELLERSPELRDDPWVALSLGDPSRIRDAVQPGGPLDVPPLFYVARSRLAADTVPAARDLLARGADPNGAAGEQWTNLSITCSRGDARLAELLLDAGAEPNDDDSLYHSIEPADGTCTRLLLDRGARVTGTSALHHALDYERLGRVRLLLERGGDPNEHPEWPALHHAVARGRSPELLRLLVEHGADVNARDRDGRTAYRHAVRRGRDDLAEMLLALGSPSDLDDSDRALRAVATGEGSVPSQLPPGEAGVLIELAMRDVETLGRVVDAVGPMFSARWGGGPRGTLLHQAAWFGRADYVEALLRRGADPHAEVETEYATPLGWAAVGSRYTPDHPGDSFSSPLADYVAVARLLVDAGARIEAKDVEMALPPLSEWLGDSRGRPRPSPDDSWRAGS